MNKGFLFLPVLFLCFSTLNGQHSDANIFGDVHCQGKHIPFTTRHIEGSTIGTADIFTDLEPRGPVIRDYDCIHFNCAR